MEPAIEKQPVHQRAQMEQALKKADAKPVDATKGIKKTGAKVQAKAAQRSTSVAAAPIQKKLSSELSFFFCTQKKTPS